MSTPYLKFISPKVNVLLLKCRLILSKRAQKNVQIFMLLSHYEQCFAIFYYGMFAAKHNSYYVIQL